MSRLLITDLDNTLYDWVTYFAPSFRAMLDALVVLLEVPEERLIAEFKVIHQRHGTSEPPYGLLELPSLRERFGELTPEELHRAVDGPMHAFNSARIRHLHLYPGVAETLRLLKEQGIKIVGYTEALAVNGYDRLKRLGIDQYFSRLYAPEGILAEHPNPARRSELRVPPHFVHLVPRHERKPNPALLVDICRMEETPLAETCYVGDSLVRDISMARAAGVMSVWARYGTVYEKQHWDLLVAITHWTEDDVEREKALRDQYRNVQPDYSLDSFSQIGQILARPSRNSGQFQDNLLA